MFALKIFWSYRTRLQLNASKTEVMWCPSGLRAPESFKSGLPNLSSSTFNCVYHSFAFNVILRMSATLLQQPNRVSLLFLINVYGLSSSKSSTKPPPTFLSIALVLSWLDKPIWVRTQADFSTQPIAPTSTSINFIRNPLSSRSVDRSEYFSVFLTILSSHDDEARTSGLPSIGIPIQ